MKIIIMFQQNYVVIKLTNGKILSTVSDISSFPQKQYFESIRMILCEMIVLRTTFHLCVL